MDSHKLHRRLVRLLENRYNREDVTGVVHQCTAFAEAYLQRQRFLRKIYFSIEYPAGRHINDFAVDAIAPLFARDDSGHLYELRRYFKPHLRIMEEDNNRVTMLLRRLVVSRTKQELIDYFRQEDPSGWAIYRNLQLVPKRNVSVGCFEDLDKKYYYYVPSEGDRDALTRLKPQLPPVPEEDLRKWLLAALSESSQTTTVVQKALQQLASQALYRKFVSHSTLFRCLKQVMGIRMIPLSESQTPRQQASVDDALSSAESAGLRVSVQRFLHRAIRNTYRVKGKITRAQEETYLDVLGAYFADLLEAGQPEKLPQYMHLWAKDGEFSDHPEVHTSRLEYLIKMGKQHLREAL